MIVNMTSKIIDLTGLSFGRLIVYEYISTKRRQAIWRCRCICGNMVDVRSYNLISGNTKSCGCIQKEIAGSLGAIRLTTHGKSKTLEYRKTMSRKTHLKFSYGITPEVKDILRKDQNYKCKICKRTELELGYELWVDHDHTTGEIRGLLCNDCNTGLGILKDDVEIMKSAIDYLEKYNLRNTKFT